MDALKTTLRHLCVLNVVDLITANSKAAKWVPKKEDGQDLLSMEVFDTGSVYDLQDNETRKNLLEGTMFKDPTKLNRLGVILSKLPLSP